MNGRPIRLPMDASTNQFAILRAIDPANSAQYSQITDFMVAIMRETKVVQQNESSPERSAARKPSLKYIESIFVETSVDIYNLGKAGAPEKQHIFGANVDNRKVDAQFSPKNISTFHRPERSVIERNKPVNCDFNFCGWYFVDEVNHNLNFAILIDRLQVNLRTPFNLDASVVPLEELQSHWLVSKNLVLADEDAELGSQFLADYEISQNMPVYKVELLRPTNFARLESYRGGLVEAKQAWQVELNPKQQQTWREGAESIA